MQAYTHDFHSRQLQETWLPVNTDSVNITAGPTDFLSGKTTRFSLKFMAE